CFRPVTDVFSKACKNRSNFLSAKRLRGDERIIERLAGHEPRYASPYELVVRSVIAQPTVLRSGQQERAYQAHRLLLISVGRMQAFAATPTVFQGNLASK